MGYLQQVHMPRQLLNSHFPAGFQLSDCGAPTTSVGSSVLTSR